jgi:hypothetical protein
MVGVVISEDSPGVEYSSLESVNRELERDLEILGWGCGDNTGDIDTPSIRSTLLRGFK